MYDRNDLICETISERTILDRAFRTSHQKDNHLVGVIGYMRKFLDVMMTAV